MLAQKNKKILIILSIGIVLIVSIFLVFNKKDEYKELPRVKLKNQNLNSNLAIMVESDYKTEEYIKWESNVFPTDGYSLNEEKSGCVDENGKIVDALSYNEDKTISIKTKQSVYCYVYYNRNIFLGSGSKENPYQINAIEDLVRLSNTVNNGETYSGKYFELMRSLNFKEANSYENSERTDFGDINGVNNTETLINELTNQKGKGWTPIGNTDVISFQGIFDGKNYTLSNIYIKNNTASAPMGLFGTIKNATISNLKINGTMNSSVDGYMGSIVGSVYGKTTIQNIESSTNLTGAQGVGRLGGIIGTLNDDSDTNLTHLINRGTITEGNYNAGIMGWAAGTNVILEDCHNYGNVTQSGDSTSSKSGGIVGTTRNNIEFLKLTNCSNEASITGNYWVGGLIGAVNNPSCTITDSLNNGAVSSNDYSGGLIGMASNPSCTITGSINKGTISSDNIAGGLIGRTQTLATATLKISDSSNEGEVTGSYSVGGIIGVTNKHNCAITDSFNSGTISSSDYAGGIIGITSGTVISISETYNNGKIVESNTVGGIISYTNSNDVVTLAKTYNYGNLEGKYSAAGLICSTSKNTIISESFNKGVITLNSVPSVSPYAGGLIGVGGGIVINSGNYGNVTLNSTYTGTYGWGAWGIAWTGDSKNIVLNSFNIGNITINNSTSQRLSFSSGLVCIRLSGQSATINNAYNSGNVTGGAYNYSIVNSMPSTPGNIVINNAYYKTGVPAVNTSVTGTSTEMSDSNMKITSATNQNGLLYKLNTNVTALNKAGLGTIDSSLNGYTLCKWKIGTTGYPELDC